MSLSTKIILCVLAFLAGLLAFWPGDRNRRKPDEHDPCNGGGGV